MLIILMKYCDHEKQMILSFKNRYWFSYELLLSEDCKICFSNTVLL